MKTIIKFGDTLNPRLCISTCTWEKEKKGNKMVSAEHKNNYDYHSCTIEITNVESQDCTPPIYK